MELKPLIQEIVKEATELKNKHTGELNAPVNYAAISRRQSASAKNGKTRRIHFPMMSTAW